MLRRPFYCFAVTTSLVVISCGKMPGQKKNDDNPPTNTTELTKDDLDKKCNDQGGTIENGQCKKSYPRWAKETEVDCRRKGADFAWKDGQCLEVPNVKLTGELSPEAGIIWEASTTTCDKVITTQGDRYNNCAGIDATLPLATVKGAASEITVDMTFDCDALAPGSVELTHGEVTNPQGPILSVAGVTNQAFGAGSSHFHWTTRAKADELPVIKLNLKPTNYLDAYKPSCKIVLIENSAKAI